MNGPSGYSHNSPCDYDSNYHIPIYGWNHQGYQSQLCGTSSGLGIYDSGPSSQYSINSYYYVQFDIYEYSKNNVQINTQGIGWVFIYGSNQLGGVCGGPGQTLLYQGPPTSFNCPQGFRYISITSPNGSCKVNSVYATCAPTAHPTNAPVLQHKTPISDPTCDEKDGKNGGGWKVDEAKL
jgi:hypothetical protein